MKSQRKPIASAPSDDEDITSYTRKEASYYAKCSEKTIDRDIKSGKLKAVRMSRRRVRILKVSFKAYQAGKFSSGAPQSGTRNLEVNDTRDYSVNPSDDAIRKGPGTTKTSPLPEETTAKVTGKEEKSRIINNDVPTDVPNFMVTTSTEATKPVEATLQPPLEVPKHSQRKANYRPTPTDKVSGKISKLSRVIVICSAILLGRSAYSITADYQVSTRHIRRKQRNHNRLCCKALLFRGLARVPPALRVQRHAPKCSCRQNSGQSAGQDLRHTTFHHEIRS